MSKRRTSEVWAEIEWTRNELARCESQMTSDMLKGPSEEASKQLLEKCKEELTEIERIFEIQISFTNKTQFWSRLHHVKENLLLLVPAHELPSQCQWIIQSIDNSAIPSKHKAEWISKIWIELNKFEANNSDSRPLRDILRAANSCVNTYTDDRFWDITINNDLKLVYIIFLVIVLSLFFITNSYKDFCVKTIILLGAMGGLTSGILTKEQEHIAKGSFWLPMSYYILVRPLIGVVASVVMIWLIVAKVLINIEPIVPHCVNSVFHQACKETPRKKTENNLLFRSQDTTRYALITLHAPSCLSAKITVMLLLFLAGFVGDKILKSVADKIMGKFFAEAEKTKSPS